MSQPQALGIEAHRLVAYDGHGPVVAITGRWLHPLLVLAELVASGEIDLPEHVDDPVVGRAAASLYAVLAVGRVHAAVASSGAHEIASRHGCILTAERGVAAIDCATEAELSGVLDVHDGVRRVHARVTRQQLVPRERVDVAWFRKT